MGDGVLVFLFLLRHVFREIEAELFSETSANIYQTLRCGLEVYHNCGLAYRIGDESRLQRIMQCDFRTENRC
jgi:hypothetical protein